MMLPWARFLVRWASAGLGLAAAAVLQGEPLRLAGMVSLGGAGNGEILAYAPRERLLLATLEGAGVGALPFRGARGFGDLAPRWRSDCRALPGGPYAEVTSVAADPRSRGFAAAALLPVANGTSPGRVAFLDCRNGAVLATVAVGFHPDNVLFSADGARLFVVNEGEFTVGGDRDAPGSVSVVDLTGVRGRNDLRKLGPAQVRTCTFEREHLAPGVSIDGLRFNDSFSPGNAYRHLEPEYGAQVGGRLFVSLQENNGLAAFDWRRGCWSAVWNLGRRRILIDASDRDGPAGGPAICIDDPVEALPMPDTIGAFQVAGVDYVVTANEGDFRPDDGDRSRVSELHKAGRLDEPALTARYGRDFAADAVLGRLRVSNRDGDDDGDGRIEQLVVAGSRGFSIYAAATGEPVYDSGSLERLLAGLDPGRGNCDAEAVAEGKPAEPDARSTTKGPEPEALKLFTGRDGRPYLLLGMERQQGLLLFALARPEAPRLVGYLNTQGLAGPRALAGVESIVHLAADESPDGREYLVAGFEYSGDLGLFELALPSADPAGRRERARPAEK